MGLSEAGQLGDGLDREVGVAEETVDFAKAVAHISPLVPRCRLAFMRPSMVLRETPRWSQISPTPMPVNLKPCFKFKVKSLTYLKSMTCDGYLLHLLSVLALSRNTLIQRTWNVEPET